ncbi:MAG: hypothetical protein PCFJNLEI_00061 [Verrucomicrobiae bacterium]|nr:hypothetical protein [Verrucomicrobiae bacterium]
MKYDVVIFGAGYAGFAAAMRLKDKQVLLADLRGDLLWESGRAFQNETGPWTPDFAKFAECIIHRTGITDEWFDGATAEIVANELIRDAKLPALYQVAPVGVELAGDLLAAVTVATKSGLRRLVAEQWIDATETGTLARLLNPALQPKTPASLTARMFFQKLRWPGRRESHWPNERILRVEMPGTETRFLARLVPALKTFRAEVPDGFVSHVSFEPYPVYGAGPGCQLPANVAVASPAMVAQPITTLVERFELGRSAAAELAATCTVKGKPEPVIYREESADVAIAGLGTGGVMAAIAAQREGAEVMAFDPLAFAGGVGVGAGISSYYYGCAGGLQAEVDDRVRELMPLFASRDECPRGFHPDVKRIVVDEFLAGVRTEFGAMVCGVEKRRQRVVAALVATPGGVWRVKARSWIDATGDGDLAVWAGAKFELGERLQPYTQSCGCFYLQNSRHVMGITNPDSGHVNPTDSADLTRARIEGIHRYAAPVFNAVNRLTYITPLLGVRQGRRIVTDYMLTLDDLIERRRFPDCVGFTGAHYDNHTTAYELESDDVFFYVCCAGLSAARTACEIPYRMLLPKGLANLWMACRAAGVTEEACHSFRMQRDIQRIGEVCGRAAAMTDESRGVPLERLRERLKSALELQEAPVDFGRAVQPGDFKPIEGLWRAYRARQLAGFSGWEATLLRAAWGDQAVEPRLLRAIKKREVGPTVERNRWPRWWQAVVLLRCCGTRKALPVLEQLAATPGLPVRMESACGLTRERINKGTKRDKK